MLKLIRSLLRLKVLTQESSQSSMSEQEIILTSENLSLILMRKEKNQKEALPKKNKVPQNLNHKNNKLKNKNLKKRNLRSKKLKNPHPNNLSQQNKNNQVKDLKENKQDNHFQDLDKELPKDSKNLKIIMLF